MSVLHHQGIGVSSPSARQPQYCGPLLPVPWSAGPFGSRRLRLHFPEVTELLEDWYDRAAENCDRFVNISEVDKYSVTCTVCRHFDAGGCISSEAAPDIIALLHRARQHDSLP